ncbi:MAG: hypothetical protein F9K32_14010 [Desulfobulbaceae bacterium]|nr:MAG: hypothetical protein F9K32_14010 [Desulfobulbaceae bacterium]
MFPTKSNYHLWQLVVLTLFLSCFTLASPTFAAIFPLEITNIKPAGTGNPAIPSTNRIFRAYPGIKYNIRAAVIGGLYPYTYSLSNAPSGMTINSATGEITWPSPQANSGAITLTVRDSENTTVSTSWSITVSSSTNDFIFVNSAYSGTQTGSISQPYSSLANMLASQTNNYKIVYFRSGTYQMVDYNSTADNVMNLESSPRTWIEYPGETAVLQGGSDSAAKAHRIVSFSSFYFDGLTFLEMKNYGILTQSSANYKTLRNCVFDGLEPTDNVNNNYGFLHTGNDGDGYYLVIQDNEFTDWTGSSAIGSMYSDVKALIENNYIHDPRASSTYSGIGGTNGISPKYYTDYLTVRGNKVIMNKGDLMGGNNAAFIDAPNIEICFNLFVRTGGRGGHIFDWEIGRQRSTYYWRNTLIGDLAIRAGTGGPYYINNNVISNPNTTFEGFLITNFISHPPSAPTLSGYATVANNLTNTTASNLVNTSNEYKLVSAQATYVGSRGWQLTDGLTPMELRASSPPVSTPPPVTAPTPPIGFKTI